MTPMALLNNPKLFVQTGHLAVILVNSKTQPPRLLQEGEEGDLSTRAICPYWFCITDVVLVLRKYTFNLKYLKSSSQVV